MEDEVEDINVFAARLQARQLRKGISSIIRIEERQDRMIERAKGMLGKQEQRLANGSMRKARTYYDKLEDVVRRSDPQPMPSSLRLENPESAVHGIAGFPADLMSYLNRMGKMEEDITRIKARIGM